MVNLTTIINWLKLKKQNKTIDQKQMAHANGIKAHVFNATIGSQLSERNN